MDVLAIPCRDEEAEKDAQILFFRPDPRRWPAASIEGKSGWGRRSAPSAGWREPPRRECAIVVRPACDDEGERVLLDELSCRSLQVFLAVSMKF